jgi:hypothetical protein
VRAAPPADAANAAEDGGGSGFAAALELAREPTKAPSGGNPRARMKDASKPDAGVEAKAETGRAEPDDSIGDCEPPGDDPADATDASAPDLTALLPGWPPAPVTAALPTTNSASNDADRSIAWQAFADGGAEVTRPPGAAEAMRGAPQAALWPPEDAAANAVTARARALPDRQAAVTTPPAAGDDPHQRLASTRPTAESNTPPATSLPLGAASMPPPAGHAAVVSSAPAPTVAAPPFEARLSPAIDSPAFAPALANEVTWLAREGVQQARLSLNPAEMGPLAVRIVLDGNQARIDFSTDMAGTRAAIEASLPTLAAALHDSGLTLAGGGVFDGHAARQGTPDGRPDPQRDPATAGHAAPADATSGPRLPSRATRGLVDLIA